MSILDNFYIMRYYLHHNPYATLILIFVYSNCFLGIQMWIFERPYHDHPKSYFQTYASERNGEYPDGWTYMDFSYVQNAIWCSVVTMTTVGFGDFSAKTYIGMFILTIMINVGGTILVSSILEII
jgi:hypothetical protein